MTNCIVPIADIAVSSLEAIPEGAGRIFQFSIEQKSLNLLVLRGRDGCYGYINRCPHFGVPLATCDAQLIYEPNRWIKCNVHYARFRWHDGFCEAGECEGESLISVPLEVNNGKVSIKYNSNLIM
jgi:nitrite reductase/ring-hydroxylating ferredoxin subunit